MAWHALTRGMSLACLLALLLATTPANAGKVYKVVDENGKVTFTDKPPQTNADSALKTEQLDIQEDSGNRTALTRLGNSEFCGHLKMPVDNGYSGQFLEQLIYARQQWERQLEALEKSVVKLSRTDYGYYSRYNKSNYNQNTSPENLEKMRDYRCAIRWANEAELAVKQEKAQLVEQVAANTALLQELIRRRSASCGPEPAFGDANLSQRRQEWQKCSNEFDSLIREGQRALSEADQKLTAIQKTGR